MHTRDAACPWGCRRLALFAALDVKVGSRLGPAPPMSSAIRACAAAAMASDDRATAPGGSSIAVLPFATGGEVESHFVDGLAEEVITGLSRLPGLFVIARNSSFAYHGQAMDVRRIAAELGVRYLLDGSVRRAGPRLRINAHLIDGATAAEICPPQPMS